MKELNPFYRRKLPHIQPINADFFVTFRLKNSLPTEAIDKLKQQHLQIEKEITQNTSGPERIKLLYDARKKYFRIFDNYLDAVNDGPTWLARYDIASLVEQSIKYRDENEYILNAYCIMPNHVHLVFSISESLDIPDIQSSYIVTRILESLKKYTAVHANKLLSRRGPFWQSESYDHVIRSEREFKNVIRYTINNPVKAGLVEKPEEWKWSWCREDIEL